MNINSVNLLTSNKENVPLKTYSKAVSFSGISHKTLKAGIVTSSLGIPVILSKKSDKTISRESSQTIEDPSFSYNSPNIKFNSSLKEKNFEKFEQESMVVIKETSKILDAIFKKKGEIQYKEIISVLQKANPGLKIKFIESENLDPSFVGGYDPDEHSITIRKANDNILFSKEILNYADDDLKPTLEEILKAVDKDIITTLHKPFLLHELKHSLTANKRFEDSKKALTKKFGKEKTDLYIQKSNRLLLNMVLYITNPYNSYFKEMFNMLENGGITKEKREEIKTDTKKIILESVSFNNEQDLYKKYLYKYLKDNSEEERIAYGICEEYTTHSKLKTYNSVFKETYSILKEIFEELLKETV